MPVIDAIALLFEENSSRHYKLLPVTLNKVILYKSATPPQLNSSAAVGYMKKTTDAVGRETRQRRVESYRTRVRRHCSSIAVQQLGT